MNYRNVFDKESKLMRGRNENGQFQSPFSPLKWGDAFTEGNSWHYSWSVFHDPQGLIDLMGGKKMFITMLDSVFAVPPVFDDSYYGQVIHEIREMTVMNMGNYAHGNQPIQHMIYLYNYAGQPWKAQYWLRQVMTACILRALTVTVATRTTDRPLPGMYSQPSDSIRYVQEQMSMSLELLYSKRQRYTLKMAIIL